MVHLLIIKVNSKEIDGVPVTGTPVGSRTELYSDEPIPYFNLLWTTVHVLN